jgi:beta-phosphoglucomutase-like phosphatase (HAD superfamily)
VEDSVPGVRAALAAGMRCVAAATALTRASLRAAALLPPGLVVDDPVDLAPVVRGLLASAGPGA